VGTSYHYRITLETGSRTLQATDAHTPTQEDKDLFRSILKQYNAEEYTDGGIHFGGKWNPEECVRLICTKLRPGLLVFVTEISEYGDVWFEYHATGGLGLLYTEMPKPEFRNAKFRLELKRRREIARRNKHAEKLSQAHALQLRSL
jgi:hypothetical protein